MALIVNVVVCTQWGHRWKGFVTIVAFVEGTVVVFLINWVSLFYEMHFGEIWIGEHLDFCYGAVFERMQDSGIVLLNVCVVLFAVSRIGTIVVHIRYFVFFHQPQFLQRTKILFIVELDVQDSQPLHIPLLHPIVPLHDGLRCLLLRIWSNTVRPIVLEAFDHSHGMYRGMCWAQWADRRRAYITTLANRHGPSSNNRKSWTDCLNGNEFPQQLTSIPMQSAMSCGRKYWSLYTANKLNSTFSVVRHARHSREASIDASIYD